MKTAKYTIILPVRNGGDHLKQCVASALAQNLGDFELAVLENASTDGSAEWLASLKDPRIRIYPAESSLPMKENWARATQIPKNEFITFLGHDDAFDPNYLTILDDLVNRHPDAAIYHAHFRFIDETGALLRHCRPMPERETDLEFCKAFMRFERDANGTGYVVRSRDFDRIGGFPPFHNLLYSDHALFLSLIQGSYIVTSPEECFSYREHATSTSKSSRWRDHFDALKQFIDFVAEKKRWNAGTQRVIEEYAPEYFFTLCTSWYMAAILEATKKNRRIAPDLLDEFSEALAKIAPHEVERFRNTKNMRLRHQINANILGRVAYTTYIRTRYGKDA